MAESLETQQQTSYYVDRAPSNRDVLCVHCSYSLTTRRRTHRAQKLCPRTLTWHPSKRLTHYDPPAAGYVPYFPLDPAEYCSATSNKTTAKNNHLDVVLEGGGGEEPWRPPCLPDFCPHPCVFQCNDFISLVAEALATSLSPPATILAPCAERARSYLDLTTINLSRLRGTVGIGFEAPRILVMVCVAVQKFDLHYQCGMSKNCTRTACYR